MSFTVFVVQPIAQAAIERLKAEVKLVYGFGEDAVSLQEGMAGVDGMVLRTAEVTAADLEAAPSLKIIARHGVGVDNIDLDAARRFGVAVTNTPDANVEAVAQHTLTGMLAVTRHLLPADRMTRQGEFGHRDSLQGIELAGKRLGLVGFGRIGRAVAAKCCAAFNMTVEVHDPALSPGKLPADVDLLSDSLGGLVERADIVSLHIPLNLETRGLFDRELLFRMKKGSVLVNMARGGIVDEDALAEVLAQGHLAGAAVDVFTQEPPPADHPLFALENVVLSPHMAAHTQEAFHRMAMGAAEAVLSYLKHGTAENLI